ncbi:hypothetical protein F53441_12584 [Fusarium austroafricanum]|uniref:Uncharacterized protein n=1 Tax=Fusarium austroafricanum TaxID=2364996 RepID=A0A8H4JUW2_9HYPO|nr:hypothetical protein F53441_12584 [Fusarium austroafricanum]
MSTPSTTSTTPTDIRVALTTAYKEPRSCETNFKPTSAAWSSDGSSAIVSVMVLEQVSSCYPSGRDDSSDEGYLSFSPACPQRAGGEDPVQLTFPVATASDDKTATATELETQPYESGYPPNGTLMVHQAWAVTWEASDRTNLSPQPPTLTSGECGVARLLLRADLAEPKEDEATEGTRSSSGCSSASDYERKYGREG